MVPGLGGIRATARLDEQPPRLVHLAAALLGHSAPDLAVHEVHALDGSRIGRRPAEGNGLRGWHGPPPARHRPRGPAVREVRRRDAASARHGRRLVRQRGLELGEPRLSGPRGRVPPRSEEHTSELQSPCNLVCRLLLEKKKKTKYCVISRSKCRHGDNPYSPTIA